jgi:hypothetical protein
MWRPAAHGGHLDRVASVRYSALWHSGALSVAVLCSRLALWRGNCQRSPTPSTRDRGAPSNRWSGGPRRRGRRAGRRRAWRDGLDARSDIRPSTASRASHLGSTRASRPAIRAIKSIELRLPPARVYAVARGHRPYHLDSTQARHDHAVAAPCRAAKPRADVPMTWRCCVRRTPLCGSWCGGRHSATSLRDRLPGMGCSSRRRWLRMESASWALAVRHPHALFRCRGGRTRSAASSGRLRRLLQGAPGASCWADADTPSSVRDGTGLLMAA